MTLLQVGYSLSELLMGCVLGTFVPTTIAQTTPQTPDPDLVRSRDRVSKARQKRNFDSYHGARKLSPLLPGDCVWLPQQESEGEVQEEVAPQSYTVKSEEGEVC